VELSAQRASLTAEKNDETFLVGRVNLLLIRDFICINQTEELFFDKFLKKELNARVE
jgi:hypothetical protein